MMKQIPRLTAGLVFSFAALAGSTTLMTDPLTSLPLHPATDTRLHLGNAPTRLPASQICKSTMQSDLYSLFDVKVSATLAWYGTRLSGFHKTHSYSGGRSHDTFYNSDGTLLVSLTGEPGKDGEDTDGYAVIYLRFQPGLSEKTILGMNQQKFVCN
jgi:hypothetical protein